MKVVLDTNCLIDAVKPESQAYVPMQKIVKARDYGRLTLMVSNHSLYELCEPVAAIELAKTMTVLPHFPVGTWHEIIAPWNQLSGTWEDAKQNQAIQQNLKELAKASADIRDRGAYIDALRAQADVFVTSDKALVGNGPSVRIAAKHALRLRTPEQMAAELSEK